MSKTGTRLATCPNCFFGCKLEFGSLPADSLACTCPNCGHQWQPKPAANGSGGRPPDQDDADDCAILLTGKGDLPAARPEKSAILGILKDEAQRSTTMRRQRQAGMQPEQPGTAEPPDAADPPAPAPQPTADGTDRGDMRWAVLLVGLVAVLWLSLEFNEWLAAAVPPLKPMLDNYRALVLELAGLHSG